MSLHDTRDLQKQICAFAPIERPTAAHEDLIVAEDAFTRVQYSRKHYSPAHRAVYVAILALRYAVRLLPLGAQGRERSEAWADS